MPRKLPWTAPAPSHTDIGEGSDNIVLLVSQDAYNGGAQYTVSIDGQQVVGVLAASAWRSSGQSDTVTIHGDWTPGAHIIEVTFLNDAWGGSASTDRNLCVNSVAYDGAVVSGGPAALYTNGTAAFGIDDATPVCVERPRFRREERFDADEAAQVVTEDRRVDARLVDLSILGCRLEVGGATGLGDNTGIWVLIDGVGHVPSRIVRVREDKSLHIEFNASPDQREAITRKLFSGWYARSVTRMSAVQLAATVVRRAAT